MNEHRNKYSALSVFGFGGCGIMAEYKKVITDFKTASSDVVNISDSYLSGRNKIKRDDFIDERVNKREKIEKNSLEGSRVLSDEELKDLQGAFGMLSNYAELLYELVNIALSAELQTAFTNFGTELQKISDDAANDDTDFGEKAGIVSQIIGEIAKKKVQEKVWGVLDKIINDAHNPVDELILVMEGIVTKVYKEKEDVYSKQRNFLLERYNLALNLDKGESESSLKARVDDFKTSLDNYDKLISENPEGGFRKLRETHDVLVEYAQFSRKVREDDIKAIPDNYDHDKPVLENLRNGFDKLKEKHAAFFKTSKGLVAFTGVLEEFVSSANTIVNAVAELKEEK